MATWDGFQNDLLKAAGVGDSTMQQQFIFDWNTAATSNCANNPVDISKHTSGSANCHKLTANRTAQKYPNHTQALVAFQEQINSGNFPHLLAALETSDPYSYSNPGAVVTDLKTWGSPKFASYYQSNATGGSSGSGGGGGGGQAPHAHAGWSRLQHSVNKSLPAALNKSQRNNAAALRTLSKARKVRL